MGKQLPITLTIVVEYNSLSELSAFQHGDWAQVEEILQSGGYVKSAKAEIPPTGDPVILDLQD